MRSPNEILDLSAGSRSVPGTHLEPALAPIGESHLTGALFFDQFWLWQRRMAIWSCYRGLLSRSRSSCTYELSRVWRHQSVADRLPNHRVTGE